MNNENFIIIYRWMHAELDLKGNEEKVFAYIYGITKDYESFCTSSHATIADMCNCDVSTVKRAINDLKKKKYIDKRTWESEKNVTFCKYWVKNIEEIRKKKRREKLMKEAEEEIKKRKKRKNKK